MMPYLENFGAKSVHILTMCQSDIQCQYCLQLQLTLQTLACNGVTCNKAKHAYAHNLAKLISFISQCLVPACDW